MQSVSYYSVMRQAAGLAGFAMSDLTSRPKAQFQAFIQRRLKEAWENAWWPEIMHAEERFYRDAWTATSYAEDAEVYHAGTAKYWRANAAAISTDVPGVSAKWDEITDLDPYIARDQTGKTPIGTVRLVSTDDPEEEERPKPVRFRMAPAGIQVLGEDVPLSVYVWFREQVPTYMGADFAEATVYGAGDVVYFEGDDVAFEGDFWECVATTSAGQSPETTPLKWEKREFPAWLRECVAQGAFADWLRQDGSPEVARMEDAEFVRLLMRARDEAGPQQRQVQFVAGA